jgi:hypothetical protein
MNKYGSVTECDKHSRIGECDKYWCVREWNKCSKIGESGQVLECRTGSYGSTSFQYTYSSARAPGAVCLCHPTVRLSLCPFTPIFRFTHSISFHIQNFLSRTVFYFILYILSRTIFPFSKFCFDDFTLFLISFHSLSLLSHLFHHISCISSFTKLMVIYIMITESAH